MDLRRLVRRTKPKPKKVFWEGWRNNKIYLDMPHAAERSGFSIRHFSRMIEENEVHTFFIGHKKIILVKDLEKWLTKVG